MSGKIGKTENKNKLRVFVDGENIVLNAEQSGPNAEGFVLGSDESCEGGE